MKTEQMQEYPQLDFYIKKKFALSKSKRIPSGNSNYFEIRESLYRQLGILPSFIQGQNVLEIGPGSGNNSLYTASLKPSKYVLVEPNPSAVNDIKNILSTIPEFNKTILVENCVLSEFRHKTKFDVVICEGILTAIPDPHKFISLLGRFIRKGGGTNNYMQRQCVIFFRNIAPLFCSKDHRSRQGH